MSTVNASPTEAATFAYRLYRARGVGTGTLRKILDEFGDLDSFLDRPDQAMDSKFLKQARRAAARRHPDEQSELGEWYDRFHCASIFEASYPDRLRKLPDPPFFIFQRGEPLEIQDGPRVVIVGTRRASAYGLGMANQLGRELAGAGALVGSGLALGVDGEAHRGAVEVGGYSFAVVGTGVDRVYPASHRDLAVALLDAGGVVMSEFPPGTEVDMHHFPARNRILAALADVVIVVEGKNRSGSLITADIALDLGVEVMAVPGRVGDPQAEAPLMLLRRGAAPVFDAESVLEAVGWAYTAKVDASTDPAVPVELRGTLAAIPVSGSVHVDELAAGLERSITEVLGELLQLELAGWVKSLPGKYYVRNVPQRRN